MQGSDNVQLRRKFQRKETFFHEMESISKKYFELEQQVYYSPIKDFNPNMIIKVETKEGKAIFKKEDFFIFNGQYQPVGDRSFERLILQIVQTVPRPKKPFGIIYVNTLASGEAYNDFKKVMELLPFEYLSNLTKIYVLQPSFMNRAFFWLSFGTITNYIKNKTVNLDNLSELAKESKFQLEFLKKILPKNAVDELAKCEPVEVKPEIKQKKEEGPKYKSLFREGGARRQQQEIEAPKYLSHISSEQPNHEDLPAKSNKKNITDYEIGPTGAPIILELLIYFFDDRNEALQVQGLFRKSVSIDDQTEILQQLNNKNYNYLQKVTNPHIIANAIKRFLANFRVPLIPYDVFQILMTKDVQPNYSKIIVEQVQKLPKINKMTIFVLFSFLKEKVLAFSEYSKMGENNLCIVFGPCLMWAEHASIKDLIYAKKIINVTSVIIREFQTIFGDTHSRNLLRRNSYMEYRKEDILQRLSPTTPSKEGKECVLDRTSDYVKDALKEKDQADCYLEVQEAQEAIQEATKPLVEPQQTISPSLISGQIHIAQEEESIHSSVKIKEAKGEKNKEFAQI